MLSGICHRIIWEGGYGQGYFVEAGKRHIGSLLNCSLYLGGKYSKIKHLKQKHEFGSFARMELSCPEGT